MGGDDDAAAARERGQRAQQVGLGVRVKEGGGFIEQQQLRVAQQQPRQADAARLAPGQAEAALADHRIQPIRQGGREAHHLRRLGDGTQVRVGGARVGQPQVVGNAAVEQVGALPGIADLQPGAQHDAARLRRQPAGQRFQQGALATAAGADQRQPLAGLDLEGQPLDDIVLRPQRTQHQVAHLHRRCMLFQQFGGTCNGGLHIAALLRIGQLAEQALHLGRGGQRVGAVVVVRGQAPQRRVELRRQQQAEHAHAQCGHLRVQRHQAQVAQPEVQRDHGHADRGEEFQHGGRQEGDAQHFHGALAHAFGRGGHALQFGLAPPVQAQQAQALDAVGEMPAHAGQLAQLRAPGRFCAPAHQHHEERHQRRGEHQDQRHHPIGPGHRQRDQQRHHHHFNADRLITGVIVLNCIGMGQHQLAQLTGTLLAQPQRPAPQQAPVDPLTQGQPRGIGHIAGCGLGGAAQQRARDQHHQQAQQHRGGVGQRPVLHQHGLDQPGNGRGLADQQRPGHADAQRSHALAPPRGHAQPAQPVQAATAQGRGFNNSGVGGYAQGRSRRDTGRFPSIVVGAGMAPVRQAVAGCQERIRFLAQTARTLI